MKKVIVLAICVAFVMSLPAFAIDVPEGALVKMKSTAYSGTEFNAVMEACGLTLSPEAAGNVPSSYAKVKNGEVVFGKKSTAYSPDLTNDILTAYGLVLNKEEAAAKLGAINYMDKNGNFNKKSYAYGKSELTQILAAYDVPAETVIIPPKKEVMPPADSDGDGVLDADDICPGTPKGASIDKRGCWVLQQDYLFDFDKAVVKADYYPVLDGVVKIMNANPNLSVRLEGHTDSIGAAAYNQKLSERRANAVMNYLINQGGVSASRLSTIGYGEERPVASNATKEGRATNRRVELTPIW